MNNQLLEVMIEAAKVGGIHALQLQYQVQSLPQEKKYSYVGDFRTRADTESQKLILDLLQKYYPDTAMVAEEQEEPQVTSPTYFTVDPLDGTMNYSHGCGEWGVCISYVENFQPKAGVMYLPVQKMLVVAEQGKGCYINGERAQLDRTETLDKALIGLHAKGTKQWIDTVSVPIISTAQGIRCYPACIGGQLDLLLGRTSGFLNEAGFIWDYPGALAVKEAGGVAYALDGSPLRWDQVPMGVVMATNTPIAEELLSYTRKIKEEKLGKALYGE